MNPHTPTTLLIDVTPEDIANGTRNNDESCPVALAIARTANAYRVSVIPESAEFWAVDTLGRYSADLPRRITQKIKRFDAGATMKPTTFAVDFS